MNVSLRHEAPSARPGWVSLPALNMTISEKNALITVSQTYLHQDSLVRGNHAHPLDAFIAERPAEAVALSGLIQRGNLSETQFRQVLRNAHAEVVPDIQQGSLTQKLLNAPGS